MLLLRQSLLSVHLRLLYLLHPKTSQNQASLWTLWHLAKTPDQQLCLLGSSRYVFHTIHYEHTLTIHLCNPEPQFLHVLSRCRRIPISSTNPQNPHQPRRLPRSSKRSRPSRAFRHPPPSTIRRSPFTLSLRSPQSDAFSNSRCDLRDTLPREARDGHTKSRWIRVRRRPSQSIAF